VTIIQHGDEESAAGQTVRAVARALDVALLVVGNGGATWMADRTFGKVLEGFDQRDVSTTWRLDFVAATFTADGLSTTMFRPIVMGGVNLVRAAEATVLGERVARGELDVGVLAEEVARINALPRPYDRWTTLAAAAGAAAVFARLNGGDGGAVSLAFVAAGLGQLVRAPLAGMNLPVAPVHLLCGIISACIAAVGLRLGVSQTAPAALIASIVYMIPGLPLIKGVIEVASRRYLAVGLERIADAGLLFMVLAIAIAFAWAVVT